jgi:prefoldin subunit 5
MQTMRESWTDERLDDGFDRVSADIQLLRQETSALRKDLRQELRQEIGSVRQEIGSVRQEVGSVRQEMNGRFEHLEGCFDDLQRTLMQVGGGMIVALLGVIATQL